MYNNHGGNASAVVILSNPGAHRMAIVKHRIMARGRVAAIMFARMDRDGDSWDKISAENKRNAERDSVFYMLEDGKEVKIYNDIAMGGTVVEYDDGN